MKKVVIILFVLACSALAYWLYSNNQNDSIIKNMPVVNAKIQDKEFKLYAPNTQEGLQKGLSIFDSLEPDTGMIFKGLPMGVQVFWMKDMKFNIDILWVNKDDQIVHIVYDVSKDSYPTKFSNPANRPSAYVIELQSGASEKNNIVPGSVVNIQ